MKDERTGEKDFLLEVSLYGDSITAVCSSKSNVIFYWEGRFYFEYKNCGMGVWFLCILLIGHYYYGK